jgi:hypothetical protein
MNYDQNSGKEKSRGHGKWILFSVLALLLLSGLFYIVHFAGKKVVHTMGDITEKIFSDQGEEDIYIQSKSEEAAYSKVTDEIRANTAFPDSLKNKFYANVEQLRRSAGKAYFMLRYFRRGFEDTLQGKNSSSVWADKCAEEYFIQTGRAQKLKKALIELENTFNDLPGTACDSSLLKILKVDQRDPDWENELFKKDAPAARNNLDRIKMQIANYENAVLDCYYNYLVTHTGGYHW